MRQYPATAECSLTKCEAIEQANDCIAVARPRAQPVTPDTKIDGYRPTQYAREAIGCLG